MRKDAPPPLTPETAKLVDARRLGLMKPSAILVNTARGGCIDEEALAETLRNSVRKTDVVARYGGEEFAIILPETGLEEAARKMDLVRRLVAATEIEIDPLIVVKIDVSAGVASFPKDGNDGSSVMGVADARLYEAKRAGRGRVVAG